MASPVSSAISRPDLSSAFMELTAESAKMGFVANQVMPFFKTAKQSANFKRVSRASMLPSVDTSRANGGAYNRMKWEFEDDVYACTEAGIEETIDDRESEIYSDYFDFELLATQRARFAIMNQHESRVRDAYRDAAEDRGNVSSALVPWSNFAAATPINDIEGMIRRRRDEAILGNTLVIPWIDYRNLRQCEQVIERLAGRGAGKRVEPSMIGVAELSDLFDIPNVIVASGQRNGANIADQVQIEDIWSPGSVMFALVDTGNDLRMPTAGRTFLYTADGATEEAMVETYREEKIRGNVLRARFDVDTKVMFDEAVEFMDGTV